MQIKGLFEELKRRNVIRVATAYAIAGWLIIQICTSTFPYLNLPEWLITAVIIFVLIGFPISMIIAWAFELTPDGLKKTEEVEQTESITAQTGKKLNGLIIAALSIALAFMVVERVFFAKSTILENEGIENVTHTASIAVLPFEDFSPEGDQEYFADGISEELLNVLAKIEDLKVAGRTSSFKFKGQNENLQLIGNELQVDHILEGSVRKSGNRIRVTAQLIKVEDGFHVWSQNFDRELTIENLFDIQDEISKTVVQELKVRLLPREQNAIANNPTQDIEAYNAYLEATQLEISDRPEDILKAIDKYKEAVRIDPSFALAYARMAMSYGELNWVGNLSLDEMKVRMQENINQALMIDGNLGKAYQAQGYYYMGINDEDKTLETFEKTLELLPNDPEVLDGYHLALEMNDRFLEGVEVMRRAYELDPLNPDIASHHANHLRAIGEYEESLRVLDTIIESYPTYAKAKVYKARVLAGVDYGQLDEAFKYAYGAMKNGDEDIQTLMYLAGYAEALGMSELRNHFIDLAGKLYPENQRYYYSRLDQLFSQKKYDELYALLDEGVEMFAESFYEDAQSFKGYIELNTGNFDEAISIYETTFPYLTEEETSFTFETDGIYEDYIYALIGADHPDKDRINFLMGEFCDYAQQKYDEEEFETLKASHNWDIISCRNYNGDFESVVDMNRELYFTHKMKGNYLFYFENEYAYQRLGDYPPLEELKRDINQDLSVMSNNVMTYLKAEGEWREEWESN